MKSCAIPLAFLAAGCATWKPVTEAHGPMTRLFVVAGRTAAILAVAQWDAAGVAGKVERAWRVEGLPLGLVVEEGESPAELAERCGWAPDPDAEGRDVRYASRDIVLQRAYDAHTRRTVAAVAGGVLGAAALVMSVVLLFVLLGTANASGRPFRVSGRAVVAGVVRSDAWMRPLVLAPLPEAERRAAVARWTAEAQKEHASVPAFARLSLELIALGAPPALVARAHRAALQEIEHARLCFAVASAYAGEPLGPAPMPEATTVAPVTLERLVRESLLDGCLGEGGAAGAAERDARAEADPELARILRVIARDEAEHAALAWAIARWALDRSPPPAPAASRGLQRRPKIRGAGGPASWHAG